MKRRKKKDTQRGEKVPQSMDENRSGEESNGDDDELQDNELQFRTAIPDLKLLPVNYDKPPDAEPGECNHSPYSNPHHHTRPRF